MNIKNWFIPIITFSKHIQNNFNSLELINYHFHLLQCSHHLYCQRAQWIVLLINLRSLPLPPHHPPHSPLLLIPAAFSKVLPCTSVSAPALIVPNSHCFVKCSTLTQYQQCLLRLNHLNQSPSLIHFSITLFLALTNSSDVWFKSVVSPFLLLFWYFSLFP